MGWIVCAACARGNFVMRGEVGVSLCAVHEIPDGRTMVVLGGRRTDLGSPALEKPWSSVAWIT